MPFGLIFGALFFGLICSTFGLRWLVQPALEGKIGGALVAVLGASLACGLLARRTWARWAGAVVAAGVAAFAFHLVTVQGGVIDHVLFLAALVTAILLVVPATGDPRRGAPGSIGADAHRVGATGWTALISLLGLVVLGATTEQGVIESAPGPNGALPASAIGKRVQWYGFGEGLERARVEGKPVLATFVTDWCPYCTKMSSKTWRASSVVQRLDDVVAVRVDVEDPDDSGGLPGQAIASRYGVNGYPVQLLLDADGRVIARYDGYQTPRQLLAWLDDSLESGGAIDSKAAFKISSP